MGPLTAMFPSAEEASRAKHASRALAAVLAAKVNTQALSISDAEGLAHSLDIPVSALRLLVDALSQLGEGNAVKLVPVHAELTTQEAADILGISRPTFIKLLDEGLMPFSKSGNRRKVRYTDLQRYRGLLDTQRRESLAELSILDQKLGLGYE